MVVVLADEDIEELLTATRAVAWMREALVAAHHGTLSAPPRVHAQLDGGRLIFTTGALASEWFGYRSYDSFDAEPGEQVVVVHDAADGRVRGLAVGNELGPRRVGAIGAVAADTLARADSRSLGLVGTGTQAWTQLWAISAVRDLQSVRVYARDRARLAAFVARAHDELGVPAQASSGARDAVDGADIVVLATSSPTPVIESGWISAGSFVTTVGPKQVGRAEFGADLVSMADVAATDSVAQISAYDPPNILAGTPQEHQLVSLGAIVAGAAAGRTTDEQRALFCSVGLAGTEVFLLHRILETLDQALD